jgi:tetratricopeptide (TPR) repeat protein
MLVSALEWGERILSLQAAPPEDPTGCTMIVGNLINTCTLLAAIEQARAEPYLRKAVEFARLSEKWTTTGTKLDAQNATLWTRLIRSAASVHYRLVEQQFDSFTRYADEVRGLCERFFALAESHDDQELRLEAREFAESLELRLRLLRPEWTGSLRPSTTRDDQPEDPDIDLEAWLDAGTKLAEAANAADGSERERAVDHALSRCYAKLASALRAVLDDIGLNHHVCRLLVALGALGSERMAGMDFQMIGQWVSVRSGPEDADERRRRQNMFPSRALRARVLEPLFTLEAFVRKAPALTETELSTRRRLSIHNGNLLRRLLGQGRYSAHQGLPTEQASDLAQLLLKWLPSRVSPFGLQTYYVLQAPIPAEFTAPPSHVFQPRREERERSRRAKPRRVSLLPNLVPVAANPPPDATPPTPVATLDAYLKAHPGVPPESLTGTTVEVDDQVGVLGEIIGRGRTKVAYRLLDAETGKELILRRTGGTIVVTLTAKGAANVERDQAESGPSESIETSRSQVLPTMRLFHGGVLESTLSYLLGNPSNWQPLIEGLIDEGLVLRETIPGLRNLFLRFLPALSSATNALSTSVTPASDDDDDDDDKFLKVYRHLGGQLLDLIATGRLPTSSPLVLAERHNIATAIERAVTLGDRHTVSLFSELLTIDGPLPDDGSGVGEIVKRAAAWLVSSSPDQGLDQARVLTIQDRAQERLRAGDAATAIAMLEDLAERIQKTGVSDANDPRFALGVTFLLLGRLHIEAERLGEALRPLRRAIDLFEHLDDPRSRHNLAQAELSLATVYRNLGHLDQALSLATRVREVDTDSDDVEAQLEAVLHAAGTLLVKEDFAAARQVIEKATPLVTKANTTRYLSYLHAKGMSWMGTGDVEQALTFLHEAAIVLDGQADKKAEAMIFNAKGIVEARLGRFEDAEGSYQRILASSNSPQDLRARCTALLNLSRLYKQRAEHAENDTVEERKRLYRQGLIYASDARELARTLRDKKMIVDATTELAMLYRALGDIQQTRAAALERLAIRKELAAPDLFRDYLFLSKLAREAGLLDEADDWEEKGGPAATEIIMETIRAGGGFGELLPILRGLAGLSLMSRLHGGEQLESGRETFDLLIKYGPPFSTFVHRLLDLAHGRPIKVIPNWMPAELTGILEELHRQILAP